ncbi:MAG: PAS domain S-box protein [candidate division NC10 bacterium]|nr:PAS domain S-box protein [candidate division NC10 bacterium]
MKDADKTKKQLIEELMSLRQEVAELQAKDRQQGLAREALQRSEKRFQELADLSHQTVFECDREGNLTFVNRSSFPMFGYSQEDLARGFNVLQAMVPEDRERAKENILRVLKGEKVGASEYTFLTKEGRRFPGIVYFSPVIMENEPVGLRGIVIDIADRRAAEEALRESERRYRILADHVVDVIFTLGLDLRFTYISPSVLRLAGYTPEEIVELGVGQLLSPNSLRPAQRTLQEEMAIEASGKEDPSRERALELELLRKDGSSLWVEVKMSFLRNPNGRPVEILGVARDITERRQTQQALQESEQRLRALFDRAAVGMALVDSEGRVLAANEADCRILGYSPEEMVGMHFSEFTHPEDLERDQALFQSLLRGERESYLIDKRCVRKHGEVVWGRLSVSLIRDQDGQPQYTVVVCEDITDRRRADEEIRESETRYRAIMEQSPDGIYLIDVETREIMEANSAFQRMLGYTYQEILGLSFPDFVVADPQQIEQTFSEIVSRKEPLTFQRTCRRKDGTYLEVWVRAQMISFSGRRAILVLVRDLTYLKRAEEQLRESHESLVAMLDSLEADIYVADLQTYEVLFLNRHMREYFGEDALGKKCWSVFRRESGPCPGCTNERLLDAQGEPSGIVVWEGRNPITGRWYLNYDRAIRWIDGRLVRLQIALDITARREAEEALRRDEARYRAIMEQASDGIYLVDRQTRRILECNRSFARMLGYTPNEVIGLTIYDLIAAEREDIDRRFQATVEAGGTISLERELRKKDGSLLPVWIRGQIITYRGTAVNLSFATDLTERKQAEQALRDSEERYRALVEWCPDGIYVVDTRTKRIVQSNPAFQHLLGYAAEEMSGMHLYDFIAAEREDIDRRFGRLIGQGLGASFQHEREYRRKDGTLVPVWVTGNVVSWGKGEAVFTFVRDLTARKEAERRLHDSEARYRAIMEQSADGIYLVDPDTHRILEGNRALQRLLGYTAEELRGMILYDLIAAEPADIEQRFQSILDLGLAEIFSLEQQYRRKDGTLVPVWVTATPVYYAGKKVVSVLMRDLTQRKQAERERERLIQELQEALTNVKTLRGLIPICAQCKKIRDDQGYWQQVETYVKEHSEASFTHGLCPDCVRLLFPGVIKEKGDGNESQ